MVEYSYDPDIRYDRFRDDRREEMRLESMMIEAMREMDRQQRPLERADRIAPIVNDPTIVLTPADVKAINDPKIVMEPGGTLVKRSKPTKRNPTGRQVIRSSRQFMNRGIPLPGKRTRRKTKMDKTMSRCLKEANRKMRTKSGRLRKGKTMSDVMKLAHRLCKRS